MGNDSVMRIAGLLIPLRETFEVLAELDAVYASFAERATAYAASGQNPHLCRAGCSHCCKSGAVFAVTLVEAFRWALAVDALPLAGRQQAHLEASKLLERQHAVFAEVEGPADLPGERDEMLFSARLSRLNTTHPACPLLVDDLCSVYESRPLLCRAYGFPVDAYAVESHDAIVFRSLCVLYEGLQLTDYLRAKDVKSRLTDLSRRLAGGTHWGRFTSPEAILASIEPTTAVHH